MQKYLTSDYTTWVGLQLLSIEYSKPYLNAMGCEIKDFDKVKVKCQQLLVQSSASKEPSGALASKTALMLSEIWPWIVNTLDEQSIWNRIGVVPKIETRD